MKFSLFALLGATALVAAAPAPVADNTLVSSVSRVNKSLETSVLTFVSFVGRLPWPFAIATAPLTLAAAAAPSSSEMSPSSAALSRRASAAM